MKRKRDYTIKDIADITGYSIRTVSRVINNEPYVKDETRKKIKRVLKETGFKSNIFARNLRKRAMKNIMLIIEKQKRIYPGQWYTNMLQQFINHSSKKGYHVFLYEYSPDNEANKGLDLLGSGFVDGVIVFNIREHDEKVTKLKEFGIPFVTIGRVINLKDDIAYVDSDNYNGAYMATKHLIQIGKRKILFMVGDPEYIVNQDRIAGFKAALQESGIDFNESMIITNVKSFYDTRDICYDLLKKGILPEAFFISGDEKAFGAIKVLNCQGIDIPNQVAVVGFDNIPISQFSFPSLTTIEQPVKIMVEKALTLLEALMKDEPADKQVTVPTKLIVRGTTGGQEYEIRNSY